LLLTLFMTTLYIVGTPIGNLEDISLRALRILGEVDFILCEDTRVTRKLLEKYNIKTPTVSFHQHSNEREIEKLLGYLEEGRDLALVTDAGTPGISDPGGKLVEKVLEKFGEKVKIESVPGPSAVTAALSISGLPTDKFIFMGFPPHKKGRQTFIEKIFRNDYPVVVYESKHRIIKFLEELREFNKKINNDFTEVSEHKARNRWQKQNFPFQSKEESLPLAPRLLQSIVVCRELSKMHETVYRGDIDYIINKIKESKDDQKGEFVVIIGK
jgi:16S rRNA (cytidine1402-2'-O)-methyltransferase